MPMLRATKSRVHILFKSLELSPNHNNTSLREAVLRTIKLSLRGKCLGILQNSLNLFFTEMYGDSSEE